MDRTDATGFGVREAANYAERGTPPVNASKEHGVWADFKREQRSDPWGIEGPEYGGKDDDWLGPSMRQRSDGLYELRVDSAFAGADEMLFGNDASFNCLAIVFGGPMRCDAHDDGYTLLAANQFGLVVGTDTVDVAVSGGRPHGFHNFLIPWSSIQYVYECIWT